MEWVEKDICPLKKALKWSDQLAEELHKPVSRKCQRRRVQVKGIDEIWAADLIDMQAFSKFNRGVKYLLAVIDIFFKYGWLPLKNKTGKAVTNALKNIFAERRRSAARGYSVPLASAVHSNQATCG